MSKRDPEICVIIPTTCESRREALLLGALRSVLAQQEIEFELIVVVNGRLFDPTLLQRLKQDKRLRTLQVAEAHVSRARFQGVRESTSDLISFLDDDDELLPGALRSRVEAMRERPAADVVVTNGYVVDEDGSDLPLVDAELAKFIRNNEIESFLATNWFASPASVFRRSSVGVGFFDLPYKYYEWTYLFFALIAAGKKIEYCDAITYRKFENHDLSVSKSEPYQQAYPTFLLDLLALPLDERVRSALKRKYRRRLSGLCDYHLYRGELWAAWRVLMKRLVNGDWTATAQLPRFARCLLYPPRWRSPPAARSNSPVTATERDARDNAVGGGREA